jgi:hypothetical protein
MRSYEYEYIVLNVEITGSEDYEKLSMKIQFISIHRKAFI